MKAEPLVGQVPASVHHELGTQHPSEGPASHHGRNERVGEPRERALRPPTTLKDHSHRERERDAAEAGEPALPDRDPACGMARVVGPIGGDVGEARPDQSAHHECHGVAGEWLSAEVSALQSASRIQVGDVGRDREAETVEVEDQGAQMERSGYAGHA